MLSFPLELNASLVDFGESLPNFGDINGYLDGSFTSFPTLFEKGGPKRRHPFVNQVSDPNVENVWTKILHHLL